MMAHPDVLEASVVGVPDERWASVPWPPSCSREGAAATPESLRGFLEDKLAHWQLPERWALVDEVPKTSVGKFDKKVLRRRYAEGGLAVQTLD